MTVKGWIRRSIIAGSAGSLVHFLFMYFKSRLGLLPSFQPYQSFQIALSRWVGSDVPAIVPWLLSFLNGMMLIGLLFGRMIQFLPGRSGATKGLSFGFIGWVLMKSDLLSVDRSRPIRQSSRSGDRPSLVVARHAADL
jgi:hypothetical protein